MKFRTVTKQFTVSSLALVIAVGCASNPPKEDDVPPVEETQVEDKQQQAIDDMEAQRRAAAEAEERARAEAEARRAEAARRAAQRVDYTVSSGDNLWSIAGQGSTFGNPYAWPLIYKSNKSQIEDADLIYPGQNLSFDTEVTQAEMDAATNHARMRGAWSVGAAESSDADYLAR